MRNLSEKFTYSYNDFLINFSLYVSFKIPTQVYTTILLDTKSWPYLGK